MIMYYVGCTGIIRHWGHIWIERVKILKSVVSN